MAYSLPARLFHNQSEDSKAWEPVLPLNIEQTREEQGKDMRKQTEPGYTHHKITYLLELVERSEWDRVAVKKRARQKCIHLHFGKEDIKWT